jgi:GNAT superfamily N-acetyltransferase
VAAQARIVIVDLEVVTASARPDLEVEASAAFRERWPEFIFHDPVPPKYMGRVNRYFADYDILVLDGGHVAAGGWGVPFAWSGEFADLPEGYDAALIRAVEDHESGRRATAFSFMAAAVHRDHDKQGLASFALEALTERAVAAGISHVLAPIRPTWKHRYPLVPMTEYASWIRADGLSIDPWIRTHQRMGARILQAAPNSMIIPGTVAEWEDWADMPFPATGQYVVPDALNLLEVDLESDLAVYREENLWMQHR